MKVNDAIGSAREYGTTAVNQAREYGTAALSSAKDYGVAAADTVEQQTARIPAEAWLIGAFGSIGISLTLKLMGRDRDAEFVGHWAPSFIALAVFSKLVEHSSRTDR